MKNEINNILGNVVGLSKTMEDHDTYHRTSDYSNRLKYIIDLLGKLGISYEVRPFTDNFRTYDGIFETRYFYNLFLKGSNTKMITAHYDVLNLDSENANDNTASIINAIALKKLNPAVNVLLLDAEEPPYMGHGSQEDRNFIKFGKMGKIDWVLNLELTGIGGKRICVSDYGNGRELTKIMTENFNGLIKNVPINDAYFFKKVGIDAEVISSYPLVDGKPDFAHFNRCHSLSDSLDKISIPEMKELVTEVLIPLTK